MKLLTQRSLALFGKHKTLSQSCIALEHDFGCHNYHPLPVVIESASGIYVTDCEGKS